MGFFRSKNFFSLSCRDIICFYETRFSGIKWFQIFCSAHAIDRIIIFKFTDIIFFSNPPNPFKLNGRPLIKILQEETYS